MTGLREKSGEKIIVHSQGNVRLFDNLSGRFTFLNCQGKLGFDREN